jgi:hypothetical protein
MYWTENNKKKITDEQPVNWYSKSSADLELTSYVLLAKMQDNVDKQISEVVPIAKWINSQRNSLGGFHSTQVNFHLIYSENKSIIYKRSVIFRIQL